MVTKIIRDIDIQQSSKDSEDNTEEKTSMVFIHFIVTDMHDCKHVENTQIHKATSDNLSTQISRHFYIF